MWNGFTYDDYLVIADNPHLGRPGLAEACFSERYFAVSGEATYRPVVTLAYAFLVRIGGTSPAVFHAASLVFHLLTVVWVVLLGRYLGLGAWALAAGAAFAVHPMLSEAVCGIAFMEDLLAACFGLAAACLVAASGAGRPAGHVFGMHAAACACFLLSVFSKESGLALVMILPAVVLLAGIPPRQTGHPSPGGNPECGVIGRREQRDSTAHMRSLFCWLIPAAVLFVCVRFLALPGHGSGAGWLGGSLPTAVANGFVIGMEYLVRLVWPVQLSVLRPTVLVNGITDIRLVVAVMLHASILLSALLAVRRIPAWTFGVAWFHAAFAPVSNLAPLWHPEADRYLYMPAAGFILALAAVMKAMSLRSNVAGLGEAGSGVSDPGYKPQLAKTRTVVISSLWILLVLAWGWRTWVRVGDWRNNETLWGHELRLQPDNPGVQAENAIARNHAGRYGDAESLARKALAVDARCDLARLQLAKSLLMQKRYDEALSQYQLVTCAGRLQTHHARDAWFDAGYLWDSVYRRPGLAIAAYTKALQTDPYSLEAAFNLGELLFREGRYERAMEVWRAAIALYPDNADLRHNIAVTSKKLEKR